jgi:hypothetical protein
MDLDQAGAGTESIGRNEAFGQGMQTRPTTFATSLADDSAVFNAKVAGNAFRPQSILQPLARNPGGNGMSAQDASNRDLLGNSFGSGNGYNPQSFQQAAMMRMLSRSTAI